MPVIDEDGEGRESTRLVDLDLETLLTGVLATHGDLVAAWLRDEPGSWGALAAQGVLATRRVLGRRLTEAERHVVWQRLWDRLTALRLSPES